MSGFFQKRVDSCLHFQSIIQPVKGFEKAASSNDLYSYFRESNRDLAVILDNGNPYGYISAKDFLLKYIENKTFDWTQYIQEADHTVSAACNLERIASIVSTSKQPFYIVSGLEPSLGIIWHQDLCELYYSLEKKHSENAPEPILERDELIEMLAHDIRSPLGVVKVCAEYLNSEQESENHQLPEQKDFLDRILRNCDRALSLVRNLLDTRRLKNGVVLDKQPVNIRHFLGTIIENTKMLGNERSIKITLGSCENICVNIDPSRFEQIVDNFINNAVKFSPTGGEVTVSAHCVERDSKKACMISVSDQGNGVKKDKLNWIFQKFNQIGDVQASKELGVGLGLAIAQRLAQLHGASIEVESAEGKGSTFSVIVYDIDEKHTPAKDSIASILIVDDDNDIRSYINDVLLDAGYKTYLAENGKEGLLKFKEHKPDLVISDIKMPIIDGFELMQEIKTIDLYIPFILSSGYYKNIDQDIAKSIFHADAILSKPFEGSDLLDAVEKAMKLSIS